MGMLSLPFVLHHAPHLTEMTDHAKINCEYKYWRYRMFYSMLIGYSLYYFTRRSFTFAMPGLINDLGFDKSQLGILATTLALTYGLSKFLSGILADKSNPRYFMSIGLFLTGICNLCFGLSSSLFLFVVIWALNGIFQGFGWPACTRTLTDWYSQSERASWWSSVSVSHNVGAFIAPWIVGLCLQHFGWRVGMYVPGVVCLIGAFFLINRLRDTPQSLGLPAIEKYRNDYQSGMVEKQQLSSKELLQEVLSNKYVWLLAIAYLFLYILRMGISDWTGLFLYETKGYTALGSSGISSFFEMGGFFGTLAAGWSSDRFFGAKRGPVCVLFALSIFTSIIFFMLVPPNYTALDSAAIFLMGFTIFGPQMLMGVYASELCHKKAAATANGFIGWIAYLGAAVSGYPMGVAIDYLGWSGAFAVILGCSFLCLLLLIPLWSVTRETVENRQDQANATSSLST